MKNQFPAIALEQFFIALNEEVYRDEEHWFESPLSHSIFTPAMTLWLMMLQALHQASLRGAVTLLEEGAADLVLARNGKSKKARTKSIPRHTGSYAQARKRLAAEAVEDFIDALDEKLTPKSGNTDSYILDGSILTLFKTKEIEAFYGGHQNNHGTSLPQLRVVFTTNARTGTTPRPAFGKETVSEQELSYQAMTQVPKGSVIIADANFGVFSVVSKATKLGLIPLFRLTEARAGSLLKNATRVAADEFDILWEPSPFEKRKHPDLTEAEPIKGRIITASITHKGYRPIELKVFTTSKLPKEKIIAEYKKRHDIELDIRQLKVTLQADFITARSKDMVEKELLIRVAAHNLLRAVIKEAAQLVGLEPRQLSFTGVVGYIKIFSDRIRNACSDEERLAHWNRFLDIVKHQKLYQRGKARPSYPRKVRRNLGRFPINRD